MVREGLVSLVKRKSDIAVVAEAGNGREAVELWKEHRPDVTLLDLRMPELDGVGAIKEIRELDANAHIVVLTTYDGDEDIYRAIKAGAKALSVKRHCAGRTGGIPFAECTPVKPTYHRHWPQTCRACQRRSIEPARDRSARSAWQQARVTRRSVPNYSSAKAR